jgi:hypothetical protein
MLSCNLLHTAWVEVRLPYLRTFLATPPFLKPFRIEILTETRKGALITAPAPAHYLLYFLAEFPGEKDRSGQSQASFLQHVPPASHANAKNKVIGEQERRRPLPFFYDPGSIGSHPFFVALLNQFNHSMPT